MVGIRILFVVLLLLGSKAYAQDTVYLSSELYVVQLSEKLWVHVSYHTDPQWGRFTSNGVVYFEGNRAALFDTPMDDSVTQQLLHWIRYDKGKRLSVFIPNHFHNDCTGGMHLLKDSALAQVDAPDSHLTIYLQRKTRDLLLLDFGTLDGYSYVPFSRKQTVDGFSFTCHYLGAGHAEDNIVVWFPQEQVLFGGCMVKSMESRSLGYTGDARLKTWPKTLTKVRKKFDKAKTVVPGHGAWGGVSLLDHTLDLLQK